MWTPTLFVQTMGVRQDTATIRCLIAKVGLDGHDRGAHIITRAFRDAGFEVIYSGLHNAPEEIVQAAIQEDVDVLGISILSGAHNTVIPEILADLEDRNADDILVIVGGIVPEEDEKYLKDQGVAEVFGPGTDLQTAVDFIRDNVDQR